MSIKQITPNEAKNLLDSSDALYVDVRSVPEFLEGHPAGAINIPLLNFQAGQMTQNTDFAKVVEKNLPKDKKLLIGCQAGGRSQKACDILNNLGYQDISNVMGGFGGGMNSLTGSPQPGWKSLNLPISKENGDGISYESLSKK